VTPRFTPAELADLLGRSARARITPADRDAFRGRRLLVTGAGGSIGSELTRELAACEPACLTIVDHSELALFNIEREVQARWPRTAIRACLADVSHPASIQRIVRDARPEVVYHAAAYKHVTMAERAPAAAVRVNVAGSVLVARAAASANARFVLISSDKAADPKGVMGATKRAAEIMTLALASPSFRPVVVRFGNVIGSSGSVVEIMRECVRAGRPVPVTDPDATRYFMTAGEAVALVLRADLMGRSAEIFWLDMGKPVRIGDLVDRLIDAEVRAGFARTPVEVIGLRPGEKCNETFTDANLTFQRTIDRRILVARQATCDRGVAAACLAQFERAADEADDAAALEGLSRLLPGFEPSEQACDIAWAHGRHPRDTGVIPGTGHAA
jgi:FlaA1/EpsC-like NDP-sugar epimerase